MDQTAPLSSMDTSLPLALRLRRALLVALLVGLWAPVKLAWEGHISREQDQLRYNGVKVTFALRDRLSQGLTFAVLAGMRNIVADGVWLYMVTAWQDQDWPKMSAIIETCTTLQPRAPMFWDMGGWQLAWNASIFSSTDVVKQPNELLRLKAQRYWIDRGLDVFLRGVKNNPNYWRLAQNTGMAYDMRLHEWKTAADFYQRASELPGAPIYLERFPAHMYDKYHLNDPAQEYAEWVKLWQRLQRMTPEQRANPQHTVRAIEGNIRFLENRLAVPDEKRVFPK
jgi:hypothetical protein